MSDDMFNIEVNGMPMQATKGSMIIQVTDKAGVKVPRFCYHKKLSVAANCRMCLVDVEKMPKPVPACATPVMEGMKIQTRSKRALDAQQGVMEFLLINHPLDCPICDEGGECDLQDTALGFGKVESSYTEEKRVVAGKNLGPLIATEMTRCIHCTRCVRFGQEVGGIMEMGATGRGEDMKIGTYVESSIESELSGNMIDLCPVGALTSKPFRFTARSWELQRSASVSPHDCVGSNMEVHRVADRVKRVMPRENEAINEIWLSDRDRFSYTGLNGEDRLLRPLLKSGGEWQQGSWEDALALLAEKLSAARATADVGALLSPSLTTEEYYLAQKVLRGLGSSNIDHRLRQTDFSNQDCLPLYPSISSISELEQVDTALLIGSNLRKDQPLLNTRLLKAVKKGASVWTLASYAYDFNYDLAGQIVASPAKLILELAGLCKALSSQSPKGLAEKIYAEIIPNDAQRKLAEHLKNGSNTIILLGNQAQSSPHFGILRRLALFVAERSDSRLLETSSGANSVGAWLAGAIPHRGPAGSALTPGKDAGQLSKDGSSVLLVVGAEPNGDFYSAAETAEAMKKSAFTVALSCFDSEQLRASADLLLPMAAFTETSGSYFNAAGVQQSFPGAGAPPGEARPAWKIFRVLGNLMDLPGFSYNSSEEVMAEVNGLLEQAVESFPDDGSAFDLPVPEQGLVRIGDVTIYAVDPLVRRSVPLQQREDSPDFAASLSASKAASLNLREGGKVRVVQNGRALEMPVKIDPRVPENCCYLPSSMPGVETLGGSYELLEIEAC